MTNWQDNLKNLFDQKEEKTKETQQKISQAEKEFAEFIKIVARPALEEVAEELKKYKRTAEIFDSGSNYVSITVKKESEHGFSEEEFSYAIKLSRGAQRAYPTPETRFQDKDGKSYRAEGFIRSGGQDYTAKDITKEEIINHFLQEYHSHLDF